MEDENLELYPFLLQKKIQELRTDSKRKRSTDTVNGRSGSEDHKVKIEGMPNYTTIHVRYNGDDDAEEMHLEENVPEAADMPGSDSEYEDEEQIDVEVMHTQRDNNNLGIIVM